MQDQVSALIGRKAAGKTDRQRIGVQQNTAGHRLNRVTLGGLPLAARPVDCEGDQFSFQVPADTPELIVGNILNLGPHIGVIDMI